METSQDLMIDSSEATGTSAPTRLSALVLINQILQRAFLYSFLEKNIRCLINSRLKHRNDMKQAVQLTPRSLLYNYKCYHFVTAN